MTEQKSAFSAILKRTICLLLCAVLLLSLCACGGRRGRMGFRVVGELNTEEFCVAFREGDPLSTIIIATMHELAAEGQFSRLSVQYLGADYSCLEGVEQALQMISEPVEPGRALRVGLQDGVAPLSSRRDDGTFCGMIPDLADLVAKRLGWTFTYMVIDSTTVSAELGSGNIDFAWTASDYAGSKNTTLSPGWLQNSHQLVVRSDSNYKNKKNLKGKIVGITDGTSEVALKTAEMTDVIGNIWYYEDLGSCFSALAAGDCDAIVIDSIVSGYYM